MVNFLLVFEIDCLGFGGFFGVLLDMGVFCFFFVFVILVGGFWIFGGVCGGVFGGVLGFDICFSVDFGVVEFGFFGLGVDFGFLFGIGFDVNF